MRTPVDLTREEALRLAEQELADPAYAAARPGLLQRAIEWVIRRVQELVDWTSDASPGGWWGILGLILLVVLAAAFVRWRRGPVARSATHALVVEPGVPSSTFRARAEQAAARGDWALAVTERMRAVVRRGQERGLVDDRPGWTADEVATELGGHLPTADAALAHAARVFDDVRYGGRPATHGAYLTVVAADRALSDAPAVPR